MPKARLEQVRRFVYEFKITVEKTEIRPIYAYHNVKDYYQYDKFLDAQIYQQNETVYKLEVRERELEKIAEIVSEWQDLMSNPQSAQLLMEARFINRLQRGI